MRGRHPMKFSEHLRNEALQGFWDEVCWVSEPVFVATFPSQDVYYSTHPFERKRTEEYRSILMNLSMKADPVEGGICEVHYE